MDMCDKHVNETLKMFCFNHNQLCCNRCLEQHGSCQSVQLLQTAARSIPLKGKYEKLASAVSTINNYQSKRKEAKSKYRTTLKDTYTQVLSTIRGMRNDMSKADHILENVEKETVEQMGKLGLLIGLEGNIHNDLDSLSQLRDNLKKLMKDTEDKALPHDILFFIEQGYMKCQDSLSQCARLLQDINNPVCNVKFGPVTNIGQYLSSLANIGQFPTQSLTQTATALKENSDQAVPGSKTTSPDNIYQYAAGSSSASIAAEAVPEANEQCQSTTASGTTIAEAVPGANEHGQTTDNSGTSIAEVMPGAIEQCHTTEVSVAIIAEAAPQATEQGQSTEVSGTISAEVVPGANEQGQTTDDTGAIIAEIMPDANEQCLTTEVSVASIGEAMPVASEHGQTTYDSGTSTTEAMPQTTEQSQSTEVAGTISAEVVPGTNEQDQKTDSCGAIIAETVSRDRDQDQTDKTLNGATVSDDCDIYTAISEKSFPVNVCDDRKRCHISGVCNLPNGDTVIIDYSNKKVKLLNHDYTVVAQHAVPPYPCSLGHITDTVVAVAVEDVCDTHQIHFIGVENGNLAPIKIIRLDHKCSRLAHHDGKLYIGTGDAIYIYTTDGDKVDCLYEDDTGSCNTVRNMALSDDGQKIYVAHYDDNQLVTLDLRGRQLAALSDRELERPTSVCVAGNGNVFICGSWSKSVLQVDATGRQKLATVVSDGEKVDEPWSVCWNRTTSELIVGQWENNNIVVFTLIL